MSDEFGLLNLNLVVDELFERVLEAVKSEPELALALSKLTNNEFRSIVITVINATVTVAGTLVLDALLDQP